MAKSSVAYDPREGIALLTMDDGKANAFSFDHITAVREALDRAREKAHAVVLAGRPGRFSGGFDLSVMRGDSDEARARLRHAGHALARELYLFPRPVVIACTGHAIALGAIMLFTGDHRIGAEGEFMIAMNEVSIGLTVPAFAYELARDRLSPAAFTEAVLLSRIFDPEAAVAAGFLDQTAPQEALIETALAQAERLATLEETAFRATKEAIRAATIARIGERDPDFAAL